MAFRCVCAPIPCKMVSIYCYDCRLSCIVSDREGFGGTFHLSFLSRNIRSTCVDAFALSRREAVALVSSLSSNLAPRDRPVAAIANPEALRQGRSWRPEDFEDESTCRSLSHPNFWYICGRV